MSILYNRIEELCKDKGITGYRLCKDLKISPNVITELRMGRREGLSARNADKIATYFGVTVAYLLGTEKEKAPTQQDRRLGDEEMKAAFFGGYSDELTKDEIDELWDDAKDYLRYKIEQKKKRRE